MFAEEQVEVGAADEDGRGVREFAEAPLAVVGAHAGVAGAAEGNTLGHDLEADLVDAATAVLLRGHDAARPFHILGKEV